MYVVPRCVYIYIRDVIEDSVQNKCLIGHRGVRGFGVWQTMWKHVKVYDGFCALQQLGTCESTCFLEMII